MLVYAGALFTDTYGTSFAATGLVLAAAAAAYVVGNLGLRRLAREPRPADLVRLSLLLGACVALFGSIRPGIAVSAGLFAAAGFFAGARTLLASVFGLALSPQRRLALTSARAAAISFGYFGGSAVGGLALAIGGFGAAGVALGLLLVGSAATYLGAGGGRLTFLSARRRHSPGTLGSFSSPRSSNSSPEPATRSRTVPETSTSPGPASAATPAPTTSAIPRIRSPVRSTSPV